MKRNTKTLLFSILFAIVMLVGVMPITVFAADTTVITSANATITEPVGGEKPDSTPVATGEGYTIRFVKWYLGEDPFPTLNVDEDTFEEGKRYALRVTFELEEGYSFADDCVFTINGEETACFGLSNAMRQKIYTAVDGEDIPVAKTAIDAVNISNLTKPVVGEMPDNSITVSGTGVTVDDEGSYWGRFASPQFSPYYSDGITAVDSVVFRDGETYMFQLYLNAADGYEFTMDSKFYFAGEPLPAPDMMDLSKSFAMVNPEDSTVAVVYINMNDIVHVHVPGAWDCNNTHHWHKCTASGCDAGIDVSGLPDYAEHSFVGGLCTCGAHQHSWSVDWSVNETHHWHECSATGCTAIDNSGKDGYAAHDFTAGACVCGVSNVITSIEISGITAPVAGETPINSASVDNVGAEVDDEYTFWVRYDASTGRTSDTYTDGTSVYSTPFRDGEIYVLQITIKPKTGYSFTADTKILYGDAELSVPDATNPTASCGAIAPDCSMAMALINPNGASAPLTYTVTFNANGGTGTMADVTGVSGEYTLPANRFTAPGGKQFKAWSVNGSQKAVGAKIAITANTTVTAVWESIPEPPVYDDDDDDDEETGATTTGWYKDAASSRWYYYDDNGNMVTGWLQDTDGKWYYMSGDGAMIANGWYKDEKSNRWYYLGADGAMKTGWHLDSDGKWYFLSGDGAMIANGWHKDAASNRWYYLGASGAMVTGWFTDVDGKKYYLDKESGAMVTGWLLDINGKWYYFDKSGALYTNGTTPDGYKVDENGAWIEE